MVLPNHLQNSKKVLKWIKQNLGINTYISVMAQYFPSYKAEKSDDINRKITIDEYQEIEKYLLKLNFNNGYLQELEDDEEKYVPKFI